MSENNSYDFYLDPPPGSGDGPAGFQAWLKELADALARADVVEFNVASENSDVHDAIKTVVTSNSTPKPCSRNAHLRIIFNIGRCPPRMERPEPPVPMDWIQREIDRGKHE